MPKPYKRNFNTAFKDIYFDRSWIYEIRYNKIEEFPYEVFYHTNSKIVTPVVVKGFKEQESAKNYACELNKEYLINLLVSEGLCK